MQLKQNLSKKNLFFNCKAAYSQFYSFLIQRLFSLRTQNGVFLNYNNNLLILKNLVKGKTTKVY